MVSTILSSILYSSARKDPCKMPCWMVIPCLVVGYLAMIQEVKIFHLQLLVNAHFFPSVRYLIPLYLLSWCVKEKKRTQITYSHHFQNTLNDLSLTSSIQNKNHDAIIANQYEFISLLNSGKQTELLILIWQIMQCTHLRV